MNPLDAILSLDLNSYIKSQGYVQDKQKSTQRQIVYEKNGEKILVLKHHSTGNFIYQNLNDKNDKGNIINFVINRIDGYLNTASKSKQDYARAIEKIKEESLLPSFLNSNKNKKEQKPVKFEYDLYEPSNYTDTSYLSKRGITKETLLTPLFENRIINCFQYSFKNKKIYGPILSGFPYIHKGKIVGLEMAGYNLKGDKIKKMALASNRSFGIWMSNVASKNLFITEDPVDALSYFQLHDKNQKSFTYLATGGSISNNQVEKIVDSIDKGIFDTITLGNDNDLGGGKNDLKVIASLLATEDYQILTADKNSITVKQGNTEIKLSSRQEVNQHIKSLTYKYESLGRLINIEIPSSKDWNQDLMDNPKKKHM